MATGARNNQEKQKGKKKKMKIKHTELKLSEHKELKIETTKLFYFFQGLILIKRTGKVAAVAVTCGRSSIEAGGEKEVRKGRKRRHLVMERNTETQL